MSASSKNIILSKGDSADTKTGELQFVSATSGQGLGKVSFKNDATSTERSLKLSVDSNEVLINNKGYVGIGTSNAESSLTIKGNINNYKESNYPYRLTSLSLNANGETNQYAYCDDATAISDTNFAGKTQLTIEIWFKTISTDNTPRYIFVKGNHGYSIQINCHNRTIGYIDNYGTTGFGHSQYIYTVNNVFEINKWQHLAVTVNTATNTYGQLNFYINGINVHTFNGTSSKRIEIRDVWNGSGGGDYNLYLGTSVAYGKPKDVFQGYLADLRIWDTELDQATIQAWYDKDLNSTHSKYDNLNDRYWKFDGSRKSSINNVKIWKFSGVGLDRFETWTDKIKSGKNKIGGFDADNSSYINGKFMTSGSIGVGTIIPDERLHVMGHTILQGKVAINTSEVHPTFHLHVNNHMYAPYITIGQWITSPSYLPFTGGHTSITKEQYNNINNNNNIDLINDLSFYLNRIGYIVRSTGKYYNENSDLEREKPTINESLPIIELTKTEKDISSFGIISSTYEQNEVKRLIINSVGEGAIMVSNYNGNIINGHYITSSALEGLGMKQDSNSLKNYTVAKSTQDEDFTSDYQEITHSDGQTYRYKLIGCTYHCG